MEVVFSDLDGTLLDTATYRWDEAVPALTRLRSLGVPVVLVTSKTRAEVERLRAQLGLHAPFVVENGGAAFIPRGCFPFRIPDAVERGGYEIIEFGEPYAGLVDALGEAVRAADARIRAFHQMRVAEVSLRCGLVYRQAKLAKQREYDEPFLFLDRAQEASLLRCIENSGRRWHAGGRFFHITGANDKAGAVSRLAELYRRAYGTVRTIGLGDAPNDAGFLGVVDSPIIVASPHSTQLSTRVPHAALTALPGPAGWRDAILSMFLGADTGIGRPAPVEHAPV